MKRSQMVKKLKVKMNKLLDNNYSSEEVSKIIELVEEIGMMPPTFSIKDDKNSSKTKTVKMLHIGWESES